MSIASRFLTTGLVVSIIIGAAAGAQAQLANPYVHDWNHSVSNVHPTVLAQKNAYGGTIAVAPKLTGLPRGATSAPPQLDLQRQRGGDYLNEMQTFERWAPGHNPLKVFISHPQAPEGIRWSTMAAAAFTEWCNATQGALKWLRWEDPNSADIVVQFSPCGTVGECGLTHKRIIGGLIYQAHCMIDTQGPKNKYSNSEIKKICLHEIGHALGLSHSKTACDIMYWQSNPQQRSALGYRDTATIRRLYPTS